MVDKNIKDYMSMMDQYDAKTCDSVKAYPQEPPHAKIPLAGKGHFILKDWNNLQELADYLEQNEGQVTLEVAYPMASTGGKGKPIFTLSKHPLAKLKED